MSRTPRTLGALAGALALSLVVASPATAQFGLHAALEGSTLVMAAFQAPTAGAVYVFELQGLP